MNRKMNRITNRFTRTWSSGIVASLLTLTLVAVASSMATAGGIDARFFQADSKVKSEGPWLGMQVQTVDEELVSRLALKANEGVYVSSVVEASPAEDAGVRPGDIIIEYNYNRVATAGDLVSLISENSAGDEVVLFVDRDGNKKRLVAHLRARPMEQTARIENLAPPKDDRQSNFRFRVNTAPYIGVSLQSISGQLAEYFAVPGGAGALIVETLAGSPAEDAGLKAGDVVIAAADSDIEVTEDLQRVVRDHESGDKIELTVIRNKRKTKFTVTVAERESSLGEIGGPQVFGFSGDFDDEAFPFGMTGHFGADRNGRGMGYGMGRGLEPPVLPDVVFSRTQEKSQRIDNLEKKIKELQEQIEAMRKSDSK